MYAVRCLGGIGGQKVSALERDRLAVVIDSEHCNAVQTQKKKIHQVFLRQPLRGKVGVHQPHPAHTSAPSTAAGQFRDQNGPRFPHQNQFHFTLSIEHKADLSPQRTRQGRDLPRLIRAVTTPYRIATLPQTGQCLDLARFQSCCSAFQSCGDGSSPYVGF